MPSIVNLSNYLPKSGGTLSGGLIISATTSSADGLTINKTATGRGIYVTGAGTNSLLDLDSKVLVDSNGRFLANQLGQEHTFGRNGNGTVNLVLQSANYRDQILMFRGLSTDWTRLMGVRDTHEFVIQQWDGSTQKNVVTIDSQNNYVLYLTPNLTTIPALKILMPTGSSADSIAVSSVDDGDIFKIDNNSTAGNTRMLIYDVNSGAAVRVSVGANDSGGTGYKVLRIPN